MTPKLLILLNLALLVSSQSRPTIECQVDRTFCYIENVILPEDTLGYDIVVPNEEQILHITITKSTFPIITNDFCKRFPNLFSFRATNQGVTKLTPDAFQNCSDLFNVYLEDNKIESLPPGVFENSVSLNSVRLDNNSIPNVDENTFLQSTELKSLWLSQNRLTTFEPSALREAWQVRDLLLDSNDLTDIDAEGFLRSLRGLKFIYLQDNLIPCSRIPGIVGAFRRVGVEPVTKYGILRERSVEMDWVEEHRCVKGL